MKKLTLSILALLALTLTGCGEDEAYRMTNKKRESTLHF